MSRTFEPGSRRTVLLVAGVGLAVLTAVHLRVAWPWNPFHSPDTTAYYLPALGAPSGTYPRFVAPFFRTTDRRVLERGASHPAYAIPNAADAKPAFIALLHAWDGLLGLVLPDEAEDRDAFFLRSFVLVSTLVAFAAVVLFADRLGHAGAGTVAGCLALGGPWGLCTCGFATYTAASLALYALACTAALRGSWRAGAAAGLLAAAVALSNQSVLALLPALPAMLLLSEAPSTWRQRLGAAACLAGTFALVFVGLEGVARLDPTVDEGGPFAVVGPLTTLRQYLNLAVHDLEHTFSAYRGSLLPELCSYDARAAFLTVLASAVVLVAWCATDLRASRRRADGPGDDAADLRRRALRRSLLALLPALCGLAVIETKVGPKFSRSYFLCAPFLLLGGAIALEAVLRSLPRRPAVALAVGVGLLVSVEAGTRLAELDANLNTVTRTVRAERAAGRRVVVLDRDNYAEELQRVDFPPLPLVAPDELRDTRDVLVLAGPVDHAGPLVHIGRRGSPQPVDVAALLDSAGLPRKRLREIPFYSHLPFMIYEDPHATFAARVEHRLDVDDFRRPVGRATLHRMGD